MLNITSKNGKTEKYGKMVRIYDVLMDAYNNDSVNTALVDGRQVWFDNTGWQYEDTIPEEIKSDILNRYHKDAELTATSSRRKDRSLSY